MNNLHFTLSHTSFPCVNVMNFTIAVLKLTDTAVRQGITGVVRIRPKVHSVGGMGQSQLKSEKYIFQYVMNYNFLIQ